MPKGGGGDSRPQGRRRALVFRPRNSVQTGNRTFREAFRRVTRRRRNQAN